MQQHKHRYSILKEKSYIENIIQVKVRKYNQENVLKVLKVEVFTAEKCPLWLLYYNVLYH